MKSVVKIVLFLLAASFFMTLVFFFRIHPTIRIWEQYKVFFFPAELSLDDIRSAIGDEALLNDIVFEDPDYHHTWINKIIPSRDISVIRDFTSKEMRDFFFYDKSKDFKIIYVPDDISPSVISLLKKSGIQFGTDGINKYPYLYPSVCFAFIILMMIFGRMSFFHSVCSVPLILFTLWCPFYNSAAGVISSLFAFYTAEQYAGKKYGLSKLFLNPIVIICLAFTVFSIASGGIKLILLFTASVASCVLLWISFGCIKKLSQNAYHFRYVPILTSRNIYAYKRLTFYSVAMIATAATVLTVFFFLSSGVIKTTNSNDLYLPSPSEYTSNVGINCSSYTELKELDSREYPDIADFIDEYWLNTRSQYSKLSDTYSSEDIVPGDVISIPVFTEGPDGIHSELNVIDTFDDQFIDKLSKSFMENGGAERFLSSQGKMFSTTYKRAEDTSHDLNSVLSIVSLFVLFVILFILRIVKGCKK